MTITAKRDLSERLFRFSVDVIRFLRGVGSSKENDVLKNQLAKSSTSIGANYEEAQAAFSKSDFRHKISICLKEARESHYWLKIFEELPLCKGPELRKLIEECSEIKKIFGSILKKANFKD